MNYVFDGQGCATWTWRCSHCQWGTKHPGAMCRNGACERESLANQVNLGDLKKLTSSNHSRRLSAFASDLQTALPIKCFLKILFDLALSGPTCSVFVPCSSISCRACQRGGSIHKGADLERPARQENFAGQKVFPLCFFGARQAQGAASLGSD
jgi:hypothetical protein